MSKLEEIYYNTKTGYMSKDKLVKLAKMMKIDKEEAEEFYNNQPINQIYKNNNQKKKFTSIESPNFQPGCLQMDILFLTRFSKKENNNMQYLLNIIDVYSRYVRSYPLKNKDIVSVYPHVVEYIKEFKNIYPKNEITMTHDDGGEFKGKVKEFFKNENIKTYIANPNNNTKNRTYIVERWHRTFWNKLKKILTHEESLKWVDYYENIVEFYNNSIHSKTKMKPKSIFIDKESRMIDTIIDLEKTKIEEKLNVGDKVRVIKKNKVFNKNSYEPKWSIPIYIIDKIEGNRYFLKFKNGNTKRKTYLIRELQKVKDEVEEKENFVEISKKNKKNKVFVRSQRRDLGSVDDEGNPDNKRLIPEREKRVRKQVQKYGEFTK
jgi:hypothetical protein